MFDFVREKKLFVQIVLGLIILTFAFWGVESYQKASVTTHPATVEDLNVTQQELDDAIRQQKESMREQYGSDFDPSMLDTPEMQQAMLDSLIAQKALLVKAKELGIVVTDQQIANVIQGIELFHLDGKFDKQTYDTALASRNMTPLSFEARLRQDLLGEQIRGAYLQNGYVANSVLDRVISINERKWTVSVADVSLKEFLQTVKVDEAAVKKYYDEKQSEFKIPEQVQVEYVTLSRENLLKDIAVDDAEVASYYESHKGDYGVPEQRQASHILIQVDAAASKAEQEAAKKKAEDLLTQLKANPAQFAELAKQHSQDEGSAVNGGDLGFFEPGMMVKEFDAAVFKLAKGQMSDVVKTDFGYHIIQLNDIKPAVAKPLSEVATVIKDKLSQQKVVDLFAKKAEDFSNLVYEQSDNLQAAASAIGAQVQKSEWLVKDRPDPALWTNKMLQAIFADEVLKEKRNTAAIEIAPDTLLAARVLEHKPASTRPLAEVKTAIEQRLALQEATKLATQKGEALLKRLRAAEAVELTWAENQELMRAQPGALDMEMAKKVFQISAKSKLPAYVGGEVLGRGYVLVRVDAIHEGEKPDEAKRARYAEQLRQLVGEQMLLAYIAEIKQHMEIKVNAKKADAAE